MASIETRLSGFNNVALLIGRILIGALFLIASYNKFKGLGGRRLLHELGVPSPLIAAPVIAAFELAAGLLIITGYWTRFVRLRLRTSALSRRTSRTWTLERQSARPLSEVSSRSRADALRCSSAAQAPTRWTQGGADVQPRHRGRFELTRAMRFYDAALAPLGMKRTRTFKIAASYAPEDFSVSTSRSGWCARSTRKSIARQWRDGGVRCAEPGGRRLLPCGGACGGGTDEGPPGVREHYHRTTTALMCAIGRQGDLRRVPSGSRGAAA